MRGPSRPSTAGVAMLANPRSIRPAAPAICTGAVTPYPSRDWVVSEMVDYVKKFERVVTSTLIGMMGVVIVLGCPPPPGCS